MRHIELSCRNKIDTFIAIATPIIVFIETIIGLLTHSSILDPIIWNRFLKEIKPEEELEKRHQAELKKLEVEK
jgi:hypothetical protein